jgi:hypothetical protein
MAIRKIKTTGDVHFYLAVAALALSCGFILVLLCKYRKLKHNLQDTISRKMIDETADSRGNLFIRKKTFSFSDRDEPAAEETQSKEIQTQTEPLPESERETTQRLDKGYSPSWKQRADEYKLIMESLKGELELEQERNRYLEERLKKEEEKRAKDEKAHSMDEISFHKSGAPIKEILMKSEAAEKKEEVGDLRSELEYCQKLLTQQQESERELRRQIEAYERIGEHSLSHP